MEFNTYNSDDNSELRKLQLVTLDIIKLFADICDKHGLRYFMVGGTMLGAVRHKGFIPWDDDADIGMPREDYEKLLKIVRAELPEGYSFLNYKSDKDYNRYFSRIVNDKVRIYNNSNSREIIENVWLDIFPYDGMPHNKLAQKFHFYGMTMTRLLYHASCFDELVNLNRPGRPKYQQFIIKFLKKTHFGHNLDTHKLMRRIEKNLRKYSFDESDTVVSFFGAYMSKEIIGKKYLGKLRKYDFEDVKLYGAEHYDAFLKHYYGDYMTPPNDADKDKHSIRKIEYLEEERL